MRRFALLALLSPLAAQAQVDIELRYIDAKTLEVSYQLPPDATVLPFAKQGAGAASIRARWQAVDDCASADGEALRRKPGCAFARFRVAASIEPVAGFPAAFPMAGALYAHTSNFNLAAEAGASRYRMVAPAIVMDGGVREKEALWDKPGSGAVLLMPAPPPAGAVVSHLDPTLGEENIQRIRMVAEGTIATLRQALPDAAFRMPAIAAARVERPGGTGFDGDADDVLRLGLINWPLHPDRSDALGLDIFVAHEFSHRFQQRDAVDSYAEPRLIHEGGGEFLRWMVQLRQGWMSKEEAARDLDDALGDCLLDTDGKAWPDLDKAQIARKRLAYRCGMPVWLFSMAAGQGKGNAFARMNGFQKQLKLGGKPDFAHALECGEQVDCSPRWLPRLLGSGKPMAQVWADYFQATGMARSAPPTQGQANAMVWKLLTHLVTQDCGKSSLFGASDGVVLDDLKSCKVLRGGMHLTHAEGLPLFDNADVVAAMVKACASGSLTAGLKDGGTVKLSCGSLPALPSTFFRVDIARLMEALERS